MMYDNMEWEELSNEDFKLAEFREFKLDSGTQSFTMSPSRWISCICMMFKKKKRDTHHGQICQMVRNPLLLK